MDYEAMRVMPCAKCGKKFGYLLLPLLMAIYLLVSSRVWIYSPEDLDADNTTIPEVTIPQGTLLGVNLASRSGRNFFGFKGIPFAEPPVGDLRFKGPVPPGAWNDTLDASNDSSNCPQVDMSGGGVIGDEDCLYLNIYTPQLPTSENFTALPVMLFVHGGAFKSGGNDEESFGPQFLLDKDVVLVVPNYRLGLLGFLSTGDEVAPGNYGLKDLVRALEWNRDNVKYFGGDPNQTTIFGQSAGSINVHLLTLSNLTNGLFLRYITESGTALSYDAQRPREVIASRTIKLGEHLGCPTNTSMDLIGCLRGFNTSQLIDTDSVFSVWSNFPNVIWSPTTEPDIEGAFLTQKPADLINAGKIRDLTWLSSVNLNEGTLYAGSFYNKPDLFEDFLNNVDVALPPLLTYDTEVDNVPAYTAALKSYYLNDLTADRSLLLRNFSQLVGDALFVYPTYSANEKHLAYAKKAQFFCSFEYRGTFSFNYLFSGGDTQNRDVSHSDELIYLFQSSLYSSLAPAGSKMSETDWKMVDAMVQLWTSFAITGRPTIADSNNTVIWDRYSTRKNYLQVGNKSDVLLAYGHHYAQERMQFWDELTAATTWK